MFVLLISISILSGCLYPESEKSKNQEAYEDQLERIQQAVDDYREATDGLVPIRTKESDTPIFQKYLIDFNLLKERGFISEIPGNAFENGGKYQYALITPDDQPRVKLIDLTMTETIRSINIRINTYRDEHLYPPFGEVIAGDVYSIDYKKIGLESTPTVESPYSKEQLPIVMDVNGKLYVDYRIDLNHALQKYEHNYKEGDDIRYILAENTPFLPAYSLPYTIKNDEPVFLIN
ncbi:hypothetical protein DTX80_02540 [Bacilli bacterium]|nr:hypothetical protein WH51_07465 [Bacilli bacterium VT-13-104]MBU8789734.1 hypothetical protein [Oceanobacillus caeni]PZD88419.1 hypothetical protein DEJ64_04160 [Bacilli bacterium]PZD90500.1 hypothetical protein DEJ60_03300 [Bacilli bacterium]PZD92300.1 hypothetical protein DEJ66_03680 [Bacilli bacterium]